MRIVLATNNPDKAREIQAVLGDGLDLDLLPLGDFANAPEPVEDGETLEENALIKARVIRDFTGLSALADDTGLEVDALDGRPGVYAARYAGEKATYRQNTEKLLHEMAGVAPGNRRARFRTVMALALTEAEAARIVDRAEILSQQGAAPRAPDRTTDVLISDGFLPGEIATETRGDGGFGYDPVFVEPGSGRTLAEMTSEEKNRISHRYRALVEMRELIVRLGLAREI